MPSQSKGMKRMRRFRPFRHFFLFDNMTIRDFDHFDLNYLRFLISRFRSFEISSILDPDFLFYDRHRVS
ncbi:hypothetical protein M514_17247 [Trichuris suis]|uniref:Uncharacterized protein n=1 Tax=Trichuris suis TaxID=68888 RepID=A0A085NLV8_9BILA|nr:hypothetical protein M514_17247 [Trichuris suis]